MFLLCLTIDMCTRLLLMNVRIQETRIHECTLLLNSEPAVPKSCSVRHGGGYAMAYLAFNLQGGILKIATTPF